MSGLADFDVPLVISYSENGAGRDLIGRRLGDFGTCHVEQVSRSN